MLPYIPPELFSRIVSDLDSSSLKACTLAGSVLCAASQPILFQTFTISDGSISHVDRSMPSFAAALEHLEESPHIARYITHLNVQFLGYTDPTAPRKLQRVLAKLANVRHFTIVGMSDWRGHLMAGFPSVLVDFLSRQKLETLRVEFLRDIPLSVFLRFFTAPRTLSLMSVSVQSALQQNNQAPRHHDVPTVDTLVLYTGSEFVDKILVAPQHKLYLANLQHMSIVAHEETSSRIISYVASTLINLRIHFLGALETTLSTTIELESSLPFLDSVMFSLDRRSLPPFANWVPAILSFLSPGISPALRKIVIGYWHTRHRPAAEDLAIVDAAVVAHPASPRITYRPRFFTNQGNDVVQHEADVRRGMPWARESEQLFIEADIYESGVVPG
ncbi:hypothetical protein B0H11DRAFT_1969654 [Mycena galericulata]|nr:hypothetical protein B0H11DRAFT_1969654 [Mycena galericulata]